MPLTRRERNRANTPRRDDGFKASCRRFGFFSFTVLILAIGMGEEGGFGTRLLAVPPTKGEAMNGGPSTSDNKHLIEAMRLRSEWKEASFRASLHRYRSAIVQFRSQRDRRGEATALLGLGEVLIILGEYDEAVKRYHAGLKLAEFAADLNLQADILNRLTEAEIEKGGSDPGALARRALHLAERAGHQSGIARAAKNLGIILSFKPDYVEAKRNLLRALSLWKEAGDLTGQSEALVNLGYMYAEAGDSNEAGASFEEARALATAAGNPPAEARATLAIALAHTARGEFEQALDLYQSRIATLKEVGHKEALTVALNGLAFLYEELGDWDRAQDGFNESLALVRRMGHQRREAVALGHIGRIYTTTGRAREALNAHQKRIRVARTLSNPGMEAYALNDIGLVYESLGNDRAALRRYKQALEISRKLSRPRVLARSLHNLGSLHRRYGKLRDADACFKEALTAMVYAGDRGGETLIRFEIARLRRDRGETDVALRDIRSIIESTESILSGVISSDLRTSYFASLYRHNELLVDLLMQKHEREPRAGYDVAAFEASEFGRARNLKEMLVEARADIRRDVPAELVDRERGLTKQLSRAANREMNLREVKFSLEHTKPKKGEDRLEQLAQNKRAIESVTREIMELNAQLEEVTARIAASSPEDYRALMQPGPVRLKELQERLLDEETIVLEYGLGEERSHLWVVGRGFLKSYSLPGRTRIERQAADFYHALTALAEGKSSGGARKQANFRDLNTARERLSRTLLSPIAELIRSKRLVIVADGALQYVPFAWLTEPGTDEPLIVRHELATLPSLSVLLELQRERPDRATATKTLAIIADPVFEEGDPRLRGAGRTGGTDRDGSHDAGGGGGSVSGRGALRGRAARSAGPSRGSPRRDAARSPVINLGGATESLAMGPLLFSREEADAISRPLPESERRVWRDFEADREIATSDELKKYKIIHFATHGVMNFRFPRLSCLVLSRFDAEGRSRDGSLRLQDIYKMKLSADLVVLSACQTALGKEIRAEGLVGLTRGFMYAGVPRVVASLWNIDDNASAKLMERFYRKMLGPEKQRPAAALRAAQLEMMSEERWEDPFFWAAFVLQGDWK